MKAADYLREAAQVIEERGKLRDNEAGERSMARAVDAYITLNGPNMQSELDGWLFLCVLKLARATAGKPHLDDYTDLAGYAGLAAECLSRDADGGAVEQPPVAIAPEWVPWEGGECPVPLVTRVAVRFRGGGEDDEMRASYWWWGRNFCGDGPGDIVAYKVIKEDQV